MKRRFPPIPLLSTGLIAFAVAVIAQLSSGATDLKGLPMYGRLACWVIASVLFYVVLMYMILPLLMRKK